MHKQQRQADSKRCSPDIPRQPHTVLVLLLVWIIRRLWLVLHLLEGAALLGRTSHMRRDLAILRRAWRTAAHHGWSTWLLGIRAWPSSGTHCLLLHVRHLALLGEAATVPALASTDWTGLCSQRTTAMVLTAELLLSCLIWSADCNTAGYARRWEPSWRQSHFMTRHARKGACISEGPSKAGPLLFTRHSYGLRAMIWHIQRLPFPHAFRQPWRPIRLQPLQLYWRETSAKVTSLQRPSPLCLRSSFGCIRMKLVGLSSDLALSRKCIPT